MTTSTTVAAPPAALVSAAEAAARQLPSLSGWTSEPADTRRGVAALQPANATAVMTELSDGSRLVLVVAGALARTVQVGPPPAEDVVDGLTPAMEAAVQELGTTLGELREKGADVALLTMGEEVIHGIRLLDGTEHTATLVIIGDPDNFPSMAAAEATAAATAAAPTPDLAPLTPGAHRTSDGHPLEVLSDVELSVTVELGRTRMLLRDVLDLVPGSVIELDRAAGSPVDLLVNGTLIARGEVVVVDEEYGVRITEVIGHEAAKGTRRP